MLENKVFAAMERRLHGEQAPALLDRLHRSCGKALSCFLSTTSTTNPCQSKVGNDKPARALTISVAIDFVKNGDGGVSREKEIRMETMNMKLRVDSLPCCHKGLCHHLTSCKTKKAQKIGEDEKEDEMKGKGKGKGRANQRPRERRLASKWTCF